MSHNINRDNQREAIVCAYLGQNRSGKSVTARLFVEDWLSANEDGHLITFDPQRRFSDLEPDLCIDETFEDWESIAYEYPVSLLVLDDYRMILTSDKLPKSFLKLLHLRSEYMVDIVIITHSPNLLIERLTYYIDYYLLFYIQSRKDNFQSKIPDYEKLIIFKDIINLYVSFYGTGEYPLFPHIEFNPKTNSVSFKNMFL
jgi:hypothetical protein